MLRKRLTQKKKTLIQRLYKHLEQMMGIEPTWSAWKAEVLPLNYICISLDMINYTISI